MHLYFFGSGTTAPAVSRKILESELIEKHHWLPQDIAKIPYRKLQEHLLIQKQKNANLEAKISVAKAKNSLSQSTGSGRMKTFTREI